MILFFKGEANYYVVKITQKISDEDIQKLNWLFGNAERVKKLTLD